MAVGYFDFFSRSHFLDGGFLFNGEGRGEVKKFMKYAPTLGETLVCGVKLPSYWYTRDWTTQLVSSHCPQVIQDYLQTGLRKVQALFETV